MRSQPGSVRVGRTDPDPLLIDPLGNLKRVEPNELADLQERDSALVDQTSHESLGHVEMLCQSGDVEKPDHLIVVVDDAQAWSPFNASGSWSWCRSPTVKQ